MSDRETTEQWPLSRAELLEAIAEIEAMTLRHPLMVGFEHNPPRTRELDERLQAIREFARQIMERCGYIG